MPPAPKPVARSSYQVDPLYPDAEGNVAPDVFVLPPNLNYQTATSVVISNVYLPPAKPEVPGPNTDDFTVTFNTPSQPTTPTTANTTLTVAIANANQWKADPQSRAALRTNFALLADMLDVMEFMAKSLVPGATQLILRRVAEVLPAALYESLYFYYGFNSGLMPAGTEGACPWVDVQPGMRLLVQPEPTQYVAPGAVPANGPTMGAPSPLDLVGVTSPADGFRRVAFDPFLASMAAPTVPPTPLSDTAPQIVAGGLVDLQSAGTARRYYRVLYPKALPDANRTGDGKLTDSVTLVGADLRPAIDAAALAFQQGQTVPNGTGAPFVYWVLRGRTTLVPQIQIVVNGRPTWVTLGTTVRSLVEAYAVSNPYSWYASGTSNAPITVARGGPTQVVLFNVDQTPVSDPRVFDLPLVQGDSVTMNVPMP
jgi:hypothetical protein